MFALAMHLSREIARRIRTVQPGVIAEKNQAIAVGVACARESLPMVAVPVSMIRSVDVTALPIATAARLTARVPIFKAVAAACSTQAVTLRVS